MNWKNSIDITILKSVTPLVFKLTKYWGPSWKIKEVIDIYVVIYTAIYFQIPLFHYMEASESKWINSILNIIGVNSFRLERTPFQIL